MRSRTSCGGLRQLLWRKGLLPGCDHWDSPQHARLGSDWIVAAVEDHADNESVIEHAMEEALLREAPVLAVGVRQEDLDATPNDELDRRIEKWKQRYPDVHVYPVATRAGVAQFLADKDESVQLAVVGGADADQVAQIVGPHAPPRSAR